MPNQNPKPRLNYEGLKSKHSSDVIYALFDLDSLKKLLDEAKTDEVAVYITERPSSTDGKYDVYMAVDTGRELAVEEAPHNCPPDCDKNLEKIWFLYKATAAEYQPRPLH